jgi:sialate O-acetylesterase
VDETWVNGAPIGNTFGWGTERTYELPKGTLREGDNLVVVNVLNTWGAGGMLGPANRLALRLADGTSIPLAGDWSYQVVPLSLGRPPRAPWEAIAGMSTLHNAMIAPLGRLRLRGVAWYQGETNSDTPEQAAAYESLLTSLMADWRARFGAGIAFLVVQLPNFGDVVTAPVASEWSTVRDAQRRAVEKDSRAALAVTIDVGDRNELHPPNKQEVGRRLARAARAVAYGEPISPSGPRVVSASRDAGGVAVAFRDIEGVLVTHSASQPIGFELCGVDQASCRFVSGAIRGDRVVLDPGTLRDATRVRFCWGDAPVCNLYDRSGLPVGPFEIAVH